MGVIKSAINKITGADEEALKKRERLEVLSGAADAKIKECRDEIQDIYTDQRKQDFMIVGRRLAEETYESHITLKNDDNFKGQMKKVIGSFFTGTADGIKDGFQDLLVGALDTFLVDTTVSETKFSKFAVITEFNAIVRVDVRMWKRTFIQGGMFGELENVFVYYAAKSIVDHKKLSIDELTYYVSQMAGKNATRDTVLALIDDLKKIWKALESESIDAVANRLRASNVPVV